MQQALTRSPIELAEARTVTARDGVTIAYEVLGKGDRTLLLANGLGGRLYAWKPLIEACWDRYRIITWDYRGLFGSSSPASPVRLSVRDQAEDGLHVLDAEGVTKAVWFGWSMGVQVSLEAAAIQPSRVAGLVLLNGTYGHVFSSGFQPGFRIPVLPRYMHDVVEWFQRHPEARARVAALSKRTTFLALGLFWLYMGRRAVELHPMLERYNADIYDPANFGNYLRLFQELDAHSAYHQLPHIEAPALVVSGRFDILTPPYQSREIARRIPGAEHVHVGNGSHFVLIERPEAVVPHVARFLEQRARW
jgi:pimeloyl-ACP methyl ester carboxylesterase